MSAPSSTRTAKFASRFAAESGGSEGRAGSAHAAAVTSVADARERVGRYQAACVGGTCGSGGGGGDVSAIAAAAAAAARGGGRQLGRRERSACPPAEARTDVSNAEPTTEVRSGRASSTSTSSCGISTNFQNLDSTALAATYQSVEAAVLSRRPLRRAPPKNSPLKACANLSKMPSGTDTPPPIGSVSALTSSPAANADASATAIAGLRPARASAPALGAAGEAPPTCCSRSRPDARPPARRASKVSISSSSSSSSLSSSPSPSPSTVAG
mmetsp:Transcript_24260/g.56086  ORF Transcript_24260/g.56086 Transcript_24260/m.56086 type:complete len:270 (-) Transcript_24260:357-1166(-)